MPPVDLSLNERVQASFSQLSSAAQDLNKASDELSSSIVSIDAILHKLNLGVPTWVHISGHSEETDYWVKEVGYAKVGSRWGIALRTREGDFNFPLDEKCEQWLFSDGPRWLRGEGVEKIPDLLDELVKSAVSMTQKIRSKIDKAHQVALALAEAADGSKPKKTFVGVTPRTAESKVPPPPAPPNAKALNALNKEGSK